jgi:uncharacterized protein (DUF2141 family)
VNALHRRSARSRSAGLLLATLVATGPVGAGEPTPVTVTVTNLANPGGTLLLGAYASADGWLGADPAAQATVAVPAQLPDGGLRLELRLPPGRYALSVFHDRNGNRRLDTNFLGIPKEQSGASNDAPARFGPPQFGDALVTVGTEPLALAIRLN